MSCAEFMCESSIAVCGVCRARSRRRLPCASFGLSGLGYSPGGTTDAGQTLTYTVTAVPAASFGIVYLGADYLVTPSLLVGVLAQFDWMSENGRAQALLPDSSVDGHGAMV